MPRLHRPRAAAAAVTVFVVSLVAWAGVASADPVPSSYYGINGQGLFDQPLGDWAGELDAMAADGLSTVRQDATWSTAEPFAPDEETGEHDFVWWPFDLRLEAFAKAHMTWYPILDYGTGWAGAIPHDDRSAPDPEAFSAYASAFAERYGRHGTFWTAHPELPYLPVTDYEIWNEPNLPLFWHGQDDAAERYVDLYLAARDALHAVDPEAVAVAGALSSGTPDWGNQFLQRMAAHRPDAVGRIDALSYHPYAVNAQVSAFLVATLRTTLDATFGPNIPMHVTEVGWSTVGGLPEGDRGHELAWLATALPLSGCNVTRLMPHTWLSRELDPGDPEDWFGIHSPDGTAKPSETAYAAAVLAAERDGPVDDPSYGVCKPKPVDPGPPPPDQQQTTTVPAPPPPPPPPPAPHVQRAPGLKVRVQARRRALTVTVSSTVGASSPRTVVATRGRQTRTLARGRKGVFRRTLPSPGRWRIAVRGSATYTWKAQTIVRYVQLKPDPKKRPRH